MIRPRAILIKKRADRPEGEALDMAKEILKRLEEGSDFELLAHKYSDGPYAKSGGDMGWVKKGELMERIDILIFSMEVNEISAILVTNVGYHIFKVEEKRPPNQRTFSEVKDEIEKKLFNKKVEESLGQWIDRLKEDAYIALR